MAGEFGNADVDGYRARHEKGFQSSMFRGRQGLGEYVSKVVASRYVGNAHESVSDHLAEPAQFHAQEPGVPVHFVRMCAVNS